jgi:hypothetical protein
MPAPSKKKLTLSMVMALVFFGLLLAMFSPIFNGENALKASDRLFNSISKGSSNYIPGLKTSAARFQGSPVELTLHFVDGKAEGHEDVNVVGAEVAAKAARVLGCAAQAEARGESVVLSGDLGAILGAALADAEAMFANRGGEVAARHGMDEREALFMWWKALTAVDAELKRAGGKENVARAKVVKSVITKGVEVGYNYYGIDPESAGSRAGILTFSLVFYVAYTLWWGMTIFYFFEGVGLAMTKGHKKES